MALLRGSVGVALVACVMALSGSESPVADAAQRGDVEDVRTLLRSGADVNAAQGDGMTALHWAADRGDVELAEVLLYAGASVEAGTRIGRYTPLHIAAREGRSGMVQVLLDAGSDANMRTTNSATTPLHLGSAAGVRTVVEALIEGGADVNAREGRWGQTPLTFAAANDRVEAIAALLEAGADPALAAHPVDVVERADADDAAEKRLEQFLDDFKEREGGGPNWQPTPSQVQAAIEASREIQRNWPNVPDPEDDGREEEEEPDEAEPSSEGEAAADGETAADEETEQATDESAEQEALLADEPQAADSVEETPDDASEEEEDEPRPLSFAQQVGQWGGLTPLLHAVRQGHASATHALLEGGADIDQPSAGDSTTPLLMAAVNGQFDIALTLIQEGADPNRASRAGATPLYAVLERVWAPRASYSQPQEHQQQNATYLEVMQALLDAGADPNARLTSHLWYQEYTFQVLRGSGINLEGATPFWRAAYALDVDAMRLLKDHGADTDLRTLKTPERRRRTSPPAETKPAADSAQADSASAEADVAEPGADDTATDTTTDPEAVEVEGGVASATTAEVENPNQANAEGENVDEPDEEEEDDEDVDHSGVPPVPVGGPAIHPIHAASGVGYGQSFAGNAHRTVPDNWLAAVKFLVEECNADVNLRDHNAFTPLHHAAARGDTELVRYLVEQGADVTVLSRRGQSTADMANGPVQRVQPFPETRDLLVELGAKNNDKCVSC